MADITSGLTGIMDFASVYMESALKSTIDKDHKQKGAKNLSSFRKEYLDDATVKKYSKDYSIMRHVRPGDHDQHEAYAFFDIKNLVAIIAVESRDDGHVWISDIQVLPEYRGYGLSKQLLDFAVKDFDADALGVHPDNEVAINLYKKYGFKIDPKSVNEVKAGKVRTYRMFLKGDKPVTEAATIAAPAIIEDAEDLYKYLLDFEYGCPKNGKVYDYDGHEFYQNYRHTTPEQFKKCHGGVCWDFVGFEAKWFSNHSSDYSYETYYIELNNKMSSTHTFLLYKEKDGPWYYFEVSWQAHRGIYKSKSKESLIRFVLHNMTKRYKCDGYEVYKYTHGASLHGKNTVEFMNQIVKTGTKVNIKDSKPTDVERLDLRLVEGNSVNESADNSGIMDLASSFTTGYQCDDQPYFEDVGLGIAGGILLTAVAAEIVSRVRRQKDKNKTHSVDSQNLNKFMASNVKHMYFHEGTDKELSKLAQICQEFEPRINTLDKQVLSIKDMKSLKSTTPEFEKSYTDIQKQIESRLNAVENPKTKGRVVDSISNIKTSIKTINSFMGSNAVDYHYDGNTKNIAEDHTWLSSNDQLCDQISDIFYIIHDPIDKIVHTFTTLCKDISYKTE